MKVRRKRTSPLAKLSFSPLAKPPESAEEREDWGGFAQGNALRLGLRAQADGRLAVCGKVIGFG